MSLNGAYDPDNIFARILRGEAPAVKVWEDDHVLAFMDVFPQSEGHVLVISRTSTARNLLEIEPEALARVVALCDETEANPRQHNEIPIADIRAAIEGDNS